MRKHLGILSKQYAFLPAENTFRSARSTEMRKHLGILSKQYAFLPAENTKMRKRSGILRTHLSILSKQLSILLIKIDVVISCGNRSVLSSGMWKLVLHQQTLV
jgi:hypothetical protein